MPTRDAAALLSLLGHELRAPAGVIGGYLALLDCHAPPLTPEQQRAVDGALRAQQVMLAVLDDVRHLVAAWRDDAHMAARRAVPVQALVAQAHGDAAREGVTMVVPASPSTADARVVVDLDPTARALAAIAAAVARTHASEVACTATAGNGDHPGVCLRFVPAGAALPQALTRTAFDELRAGLGLRLPLAAALLRHAGGQVHDLEHDGAAAGVDVLLPLAPR